MVILFSCLFLSRIKNLIKGREAYIVPGVLHKDDIYLADLLGRYFFSGISLHKNDYGL